MQIMSSKIMSHGMNVSKNTMANSASSANCGGVLEQKFAGAFTKMNTGPVADRFQSHRK